MGRSRSRPRSRLPHWWRFWSSVRPASPRWACRCAASTRRGRRRDWPRVAPTGPRPPNGSAPAARWWRCGETVRSSSPGSVRNRHCYPVSPSPRKRWPPSNPVSDDRGSATLIGAAMVGVLVAVTMGMAVVGAVVIARHRAQAAADLAAHAAATALPSGRHVACAQATSVASAMGTALSDCVIDGLDAVVTVDAATGVRQWRARAQARAGPV
ncbi:flp pilus-assembly TadE/G-like family protein [Mycolicibacterium fluoranthenivorans]|uniref:Flp pilus-assembly TadE/G-like family protein n=2 Tax=Mycolicibacterium fluoranthenivorans TaxID=258505 RepID=A0A7G8PQ49_9MYCO|nr:flp pilus-assembly TadE/G-like family protein [Mycolicibacterium fluoranthenivorans]